MWGFKTEAGPHQSQFLLAVLQMGQHCYFYTHRADCHLRFPLTLVPTHKLISAIIFLREKNLAKLFPFAADDYGKRTPWGWQMKKNPEMWGIIIVELTAVWE